MLGIRLFFGYFETALFAQFKYSEFLQLHGHTQCAIVSAAFSALLEMPGKSCKNDEFCHLSFIGVREILRNRNNSNIFYIFRQENFSLSSTVMKRHKKQILMLESLGYSGMLLQAFNETNIDIAGDMPARSIKRYTIYYAAGASFNGMLEWLKNGCKETVEEIVDSIYDFMNVEDKG